MRQNPKQCSLWYVVAFLGILLVILQCFNNASYNDYEDESLTVNNDNNNVNEGAAVAGPEAKAVEQICEPCPPQREAEQPKPENVVQVPIAEIMKGKPIALPQDDKQIIDYIWSNNHLQPPSQEPYNLKAPNIDPSMGQGQFIRRVLNNMTDGFFVECGALDGETRSNSLFMEMNLNWKGLLIEGDPSNFALVQKKNRKAWIANTCLAVKPYPHTATYWQSFNVGKIVGVAEDEETPVEKAHHVNVQCMPLFSLLTALNVTTIDYFSLDVEGSELKVLKTIPFDKINIRTLSVEFAHTTEGKDELLKFVTSQGYTKIGEVLNKDSLANDFMFAKNDVPIPDDMKPKGNGTGI